MIRGGGVGRAKDVCVRERGREEIDSQRPERKSREVDRERFRAREKYKGRET